MNYPVQDVRSGSAHQPLIAGVELGGTKCICTLATGPNDIRDQCSVPTSDPATTLSAIRAVLDGWWADGGFAALGIASFGPLCLDTSLPEFGHVMATTKAGWQGADVAGVLSAGYDVPLSFDTDVNGAAMAELRWGSGRGISDFAYITVGTGVGVGLIVNGATIRGFGHCEMGHLRVARLPDDHWPSSCDFHDNCVEGLASGSALQLALAGRSVADLQADDPLWNRVAHAVAQLCHALCCTTAPRRIAIGGGVFANQPHLLARIEPALRESLNGYLTLPQSPYIMSPEMDTQAGPMGPIALALAEGGLSVSA